MDVVTEDSRPNLSRNLRPHFVQAAVQAAVQTAVHQTGCRLSSKTG